MGINDFNLKYQTSVSYKDAQASTLILVDDVLTDEALDYIYPHIDKFVDVEDGTVDFGGGMVGLTVSGLLVKCNGDYKQLVNILDLNFKGGAAIAKVIVDECKRGKQRQDAEFYGD